MLIFNKLNAYANLRLPQLFALLRTRISMTRFLAAHPALSNYAPTSTTYRPPRPTHQLPARAQPTRKAGLCAPPQAQQMSLPFDDPLPATSNLPNALRYVRLGQEIIGYHFKRARRKSIGFILNGEGLQVSAPKWVSLAEVEQALQSKARWILAKRTEWAERQRHNPIPSISWHSGSVLPFLGGQLQLSLDSAKQVWLEPALDPNQLPTLHLPLTEQASMQQIRDRVHGWLQQQAKQIFAERLAVYTQKLGGQPIAWALSSATTQWGSCTAQGKIRLNWRLVHFGLSVIDYVIAHELAHLKEMNHGPSFWQTVAELFPNYADAKQTLKFVQPETLYEA